ARGTITEAAVRGERVFIDVGCAACHTPVLQTGKNASLALQNKLVPLFSDLLLHDIGTGDGIEQENAGADEIRTPALWGLRFRRPLLHDGSAATLEKAIGRHKGEAESVTERFLKLAPESQRDLLEFLKSL